MKVIVTGATGLVGGQCVQECIKNPRITHAFVITRRPISEDPVKNSKITNIIHEDLGSYPPELLAKLEGAEGCLWALGGKVGDQFPDLETAKKVQVGFLLAAAEAFAQHLSKPGGPPFRIVFCSGDMAEWDQDKQLYLMADTRRVKGLAEKGLCDLADQHSDRLQVWCARPSYISSPGPNLLARTMRSLTTGIGADQLAAAMVRILLDGYEKRIVDKETLVSLGQEKTAKA